MPSSNAAVPLQSPTRVALQVLLVIAGVAFALWAVHRLAFILLVLIGAALFAYVIAPLVQLVRHPIRLAGRRRRLPRGAAIVFVYIVMAGSVSACAALLLPRAAQQVNDMIARAPVYAQSIMAWERGWSGYYERLRIPVEVRQDIDRSLVAGGEAAVQSARESLVATIGALSNLPSLVLIPILGFFLLRDAASFRRTIVTTLPHRLRLRGHRLFEEMNATLATYVRAQLLGCVLVGSICGVGFAILRVPYPALLGVLAGVLEFIPLVGPFLCAVLASIVAALHAPVLALWVVGFLTGFRLVQDYVIYPRLVGRGLHLHPLAVIVAVLTGAELDGIAGMFLAVPATAIASVLYRHWLTWCSGDELAARRLGAVQASHDVED